MVAEGGVDGGVGPVHELEFSVAALLGDGVHLGEEDGGHQDAANHYQGDRYSWLLYQHKLYHCGTG